MQVYNVYIIGTHFIQNIRIIPCDSNQCQFKVVYDVVADHKVTGGSFIMLYNGEDDIHYFVGRRMDSIPVKGLTRDHYNVLVFPLNESGLPFELPSNPRKEIVNVSTYKGMVEYLLVDTIHINISLYS